MTDNPCNCETCPNKYIHHNSRMGTDRPRCKITQWFLDTEIFQEMNEDFFSKSVCPLHPQAREYLMKDVINELENRKSCTDIKFDWFYDETIKLIKEGVKK